MELIKPDYFSVLTRVFAVESRNILTVSVLCGFRFDDPEKFLEEEAIWEVAGSALSRAAVFDHGWPKPRGEYLVAGRCYVPDGREAPAAKVSIRFSQLSKTVYVFGDRRWTTPLHGIKAISAPEPFSMMDMSWERAFGGEGYEENPVGEGIKPQSAENRRLEIRLPNIEEPGRLIASPGDRPHPAGIGPRGLDWPARLKKLGTFDDKWLRDHWPAFPGDFDFGYFNMAPEDQQLDGYFRGGEVFDIRGMHSESPRIEGRTPELRARVFAAYDDNVNISEIKTSLDTVWFFPNYMTGVLIWRGSLSVRDDEAGDVTRLGVFSESLQKEPLPREYYQELLTQVEEEPVQEVIAVQEEEPPMEVLPAEPPVPEPAAGDSRLSEALAAITASALEIEGKIDAQLRDRGIDPERILAEPQSLEFSSIPEPPQGDDPQAFIKHLAARNQALQDDLDRRLAARGVDPSAFAEEPSDIDASPEKLDAILNRIPDNHSELKAGILELKNDLMQGRVKIDQLMKQAEETVSPEEEPALIEEAEELEAPDSTFTREEIYHRYQRGDSLADLELSGLDLSGGSLSGADFSGARLERTNLAGTDLSGVNLRSAMLADADFSSSNLSGAALIGASGVRAKLASANLSGVNLTGADLTGVDLTGADLTGADLTDADLTGATLKQVKGRDMTAVRARLVEAELDEGDFSHTDLTAADLDSVSLNAAVFKSSRLTGVSWTGAGGKAADFENADLTSARTNGPAALTQASFKNADLTKSYWEEMDFSEADFSRATMTDCTLNRCDLSRAVFYAADARRADFSKSDLSEADARFINLFDGSLRKACLDLTNFQGANLSGVDFYHCEFNKTKVEQARLNRTMFTVWRKNDGK